ncbi:MAG: SMP-30/gluconolactonase/LRE family protein [Planctomyces sp.]|nr:SMP-30/gluconolactonase/LRE family protein [Planctomyces sp.]
MFRIGLLLLAIVVGVAAPAQAQRESYPDHPDSVRQPGVPEGKVEGPLDWSSSIYPGTQRQFWIYVPAQYDAAKPACVLVTQDGLGMANGWKLPVVMDNLIHSGEMPVTIGIFISPGVVPAPHENAQPRFNRSFEYDALGDRYARFLLEEILPEVGGRYNLSQDPNDRAIAGASSGAICAFTVAWERPDAFRRVLSSIGTYVGLRGGNEYPVLVRKTEPKPIRVFLQDGSNDLDIYAGSWWVANQDMLSALTWAGYDVHHIWGEGGHNGQHTAAILPDALRWLWRDYPEPIRAAHPDKHRVDVLIPGQSWELVSEGYKFTEGGAVNAAGEVFFTDIPNNRIHRIAVDGTVSVFAENTQGANGLKFGPDGRLYACQDGARQIGRYDDAGNVEAVVSGVNCNDLVMMHDGQGYFTDPTNRKLWWFNTAGEKKIVDEEGLEFPNGLATSTDQTLLFVADTRTRFVLSYQIQPDGSLAHKQPYGWLHCPDDTTQSGADGMTVDVAGRQYVTTKLGLQVLDQTGRVNLILPTPNRRWLANVAFGGVERDVIYIFCSDKVYRRRLNTRGAVGAEPPFQPPRPQL